MSWRVSRAQTRRPYHLNFFCHAPPAPDAAREARWRAALEPYYREFELDPGHGATETVRTRSLPRLRTRRDGPPPIVSFHFGRRHRAARSRAFVGITRDAGDQRPRSPRRAEARDTRGVDAIIAQGLEAGGHRGQFLERGPDGQLGTGALVREIVRAVRTPVIAAGGIANAADVAAAVDNGAAGVQCRNVVPALAPSRRRGRASRGAGERRARETDSRTCSAAGSRAAS
jgi:nitronate monooxygenase